ncbi:hypothetical protein XCR_2971 [Xanthomonas campestris pv. raphani 756C]|nr:hypothetical protein XCR_2971 [Xanthomonas campestris pv. raphani 756C]
MPYASSTTPARRPALWRCKCSSGTINQLSGHNRLSAPPMQRWSG